MHLPWLAASLRGLRGTFMSMFMCLCLNCCCAVLLLVSDFMLIGSALMACLAVQVTREAVLLTGAVLPLTASLR